MKYYCTVIITIATFLSIGCERGTIEDTFEFAESITRVKLRVDASDVTIQPALGSSSTVEVDVVYWGIKADFDARIEGSVLIVDLNCRPNCNGEIEVSVPSEVFIDAHVDSGNVEIRNMEGNIKASTDSGNITIEEAAGDSIEASADSGNITINDAASDLFLDVDSGNIRGRELHAQTCDAETDSGNVELKFGDTPSDVDVSADSGNVSLTVPSGAYNIYIHTDSGNSTTNMVTDDPNAPESIRAETDSGNVSIHGF